MLLFDIILMIFPTISPSVACNLPGTGDGCGSGVVTVAALGVKS